MDFKRLEISHTLVLIPTALAKLLFRLVVPRENRHPPLHGGRKSKVEHPEGRTSDGLH